VTRKTHFTVSLPTPVAKRLHQLAPKSGELQRLLESFILEGLNRHELDCLWCSIKEREAARERDEAVISLDRRRCEH
jgi:hypothetical protein